MRKNRDMFLSLWIKLANHWTMDLRASSKGSPSPLRVVLEGLSATSAVEIPATLDIGYPTSEA